MVYLSPGRVRGSLSLCRCASAGKEKVLGPTHRLAGSENRGNLEPCLDRTSPSLAGLTRGHPSPRPLSPRALACRTGGVGQRAQDGTQHPSSTVKTSRFQHPVHSLMTPWLRPLGPECSAGLSLKSSRTLATLASVVKPTRGLWELFSVSLFILATRKLSQRHNF